MADEEKPEEYALLTKVQSLLNHTPCSHKALGRPTCFSDEGPGWTSRTVTKRLISTGKMRSENEYRGWGQIDPESLCRSCAAFWHVGQAINALDRHYMLLAIDAAEQAQKARV